MKLALIRGTSVAIPIRRRKHARPSHEGKNVISTIGKAWARSGLLAGKDALKASASTLEKAAGLRNHLAKTCKREDDAIKV